MSDPFVMPAPATGDGIDFNTVKGSLLLITVLSHEEHVPTVHTLPGEKSPAVRADVTVIDGARRGEEFVNALIFPKVLQSQLSRSIGQRVLGRLTQSDPKPGKSAAWQLDPASPADMETARAYLAQQSSQPASTGAQGALPPF